MAKCWQLRVSFWEAILEKLKATDQRGSQLPQGILEALCLVKLQPLCEAQSKKVSAQQYYAVATSLATVAMPLMAMPLMVHGLKNACSWRSLT